MSEKEITIDLMEGGGYDSLRLHNRDMFLAQKLLDQRFLHFENGEKWQFYSVKELLKEVEINKGLIDTLGGIFRKCVTPGEVKSHSGDVLEAMSRCSSDVRAHIERFCNENVENKDEALVKYYYDRTIENSKYFITNDSQGDDRFRLAMFYCLTGGVISSHTHEHMVASLILILNGLTVCSENIEDMCNKFMVLFDDCRTFSPNKSIDEYGIVAVRKFFSPICFSHETEK